MGFYLQTGYFYRQYDLITHDVALLKPCGVMNRLVNPYEAHVARS